MAYFALLRIGKINTVINPNFPSSSHRIKVQHVHMGWEGGNPPKLKITIPHSKTDQIGSNTTLIIDSQPQSALYSVKATVAYLSCRPYTTQNNNFFIHLISKPLSRSNSMQCSKNFKGINNSVISDHFRTHSFRIGRAMDQALQGTPHADTRRFGRCKSTAFLNYIHIR